MLFERFCKEKISEHIANLQSLEQNFYSIDLNREKLISEYEKTTHEEIGSFKITDDHLFPLISAANSFIGSLAITVANQNLTDISLIAITQLLCSKSLLIVDLDISNNLLISKNSISKLTSCLNENKNLKKLKMSGIFPLCDAKIPLINSIIDSKTMVDLDLGFINNLTFEHLTNKLLKLNFLSTLKMEEGYFKR